MKALWEANLFWDIQISKNYQDSTILNLRLLWIPCEQLLFEPPEVTNKTKWNQKRAKKEPARAKEPSKTPLQKRVAKVSKKVPKKVSAALAFGSNNS